MYGCPPYHPLPLLKCPRIMPELWLTEDYRLYAKFVWTEWELENFKTSLDIKYLTLSERSVSMRQKISYKKFVRDIIGNVCLFFSFFLSFSR